jgi:hypothetical protein
VAEATTRRTGLFRETGGTGLNLYSGYLLTEEFQRELQGLNGVRIYTEMGTTPIVGAILFVIEQMVAQVEWKVNPGTEEAADKEPAEFISGALFDDMSYSWSDTLSEICSCFQFGWAYMETVFKMRKGRDVRGDQATSKFNDAKIGWRKWSLRGQNTLDGWEIDDSGGIKGMWQRLPTMPSDRVLIPIEKSLLFRTKIDRNSPEGKSILRSAYSSWWYGKRFAEIEAIGIERDLAGLPMLTPPEGLDLWNQNDQEAASTLRAATKLVQSVKRGEKEGVLLPYGWKLELLGSGSRRNFDVGSIITRYDTRIAQSCLADFLMLGQGKTGSWALSSDKTDMFVLALGSFLRRIKDTVNRHAIPLLLELNGMDVEDPPVLEHGDIETQNLQELAQYVTALASVGAVQFPDPELEDYLRIAGDLPPAPETPEVPREPAEPLLPDDMPPLTKRQAWEKLNELREAMKVKRNGNGNGKVDDDEHRVMGFVGGNLPDDVAQVGFFDGGDMDKVYCPTGEGGGVDPTCSPPGGSKGETVAQPPPYESMGVQNKADFLKEAARVKDVAEAFTYVRSVMGHNLIVEGGPQVMSTPETRFHIRQLANVPAPILKAYAEAGGKIRIGLGGFPDIDSMQAFKGVMPRGWPQGSSWDQVNGGFNPQSKTAMIGVGNKKSAGSGSVATILHELGHGVDSVKIGAPHTTNPEYLKIHDRYKPFVDAYEQHPEEFFAESFARMHASKKSRTAMMNKYPDMYRHFKKLGLD